MRESNPIYIYSFFFFLKLYIYIYILFLVKVFASEIRLRMFVSLVLLVTASRYHCLLGWLYLDHSNQKHGYQTFCLVPLLHTQRKKKNIYIYIYISPELNTLFIVEYWETYPIFWISLLLLLLLFFFFFFKLNFNFFPYVLLISKY